MNPEQKSNQSGQAGNRFLGLLLCLVPLAINAGSLGALLDSDGIIQGETKLLAIHVFQAVCALAGLLLLLRPTSFGLPAGLRSLGVAVCVMGIGLGLWGTSQQGRLPTLREVSDLVSTQDPYVGTDNLVIDAKRLEEARAKEGNVEELAEAMELLADTLLRHGRNDESVELLQEELELAISSGLSSDVINRIRRALGIAYMRTGEASHCIEMHNPASCLFPIRGEGVWNNPAGAVQAAVYFTEFLRERPEDMDVRWLLNVAHMVAGTHPSGVPEEFLIKRSVFDSDQKVPWFSDVAGAVGVDYFSLAGGAIMDDFDGDGLLDMFTTTMDVSGPARYFHNRGDGTFEDLSEQVGIEDQWGGLNCVQADYDSDGDIDVLILRGGWQGKRFGNMPNSLLRLEDDGSFTDVTKESGLGEQAWGTQVGSWADYDNDGDMDLFIGNEYHPCQLFKNDGTGHFTDIGAAAGVVGPAWCVVKGATWGDYDNDGDPDLYVSNYGKPNILYRNDGDDTFVDVAGELGLQGTNDTFTTHPRDADAPTQPLLAIRGKDLTARDIGSVTFATWFWDMNNDGWLDIYVGGFGGSLADVAADYVGDPVAVRRHLLIFRNDGRGGFEDVSQEMGVDDVHLPMGANFGDIDNDGYQDFYLGTGKPPFEVLVPNVMYHNVAGERFVDVTAACGVGHLQKGHGVAFGDLDNDGDQDIYAQMGGFYPADKFRDALFENPGNENHWITIELLGVQSNHFGVGTRIRVVVSTPAGEREIHALTGSGGSFGASSLRQEIGLGDATSIVRLEVAWPTSQTTQVFEDVGMDAFVRVTEGEAVLTVLERATIELGG